MAIAGPADLPNDLARRISWVWLGVCLLAYSATVLQTAWVSDDAYISLRTVSNWLQGHGLRWNAGERVQAFTHPLWLFGLAAAHALSGEPFYSTLYLSWLVSTAAGAVLLFAVPGRLVEKTIAAFVLIFSQAFVDYSSSGLENPLTHLLVAAFVAAFLRLRAPKARAIGLSLIAGLAVLNRLDTALLFAPAMLREVIVARRRVSPFAYLVGALPLAAWEVFSLLYYGFPFPNTAYAKLGQEQGSLSAVIAGLFYLVSSLEVDGITLGAIVGSVGLACYRRDRERLWLLLGAIAYVAYVVRIGGDFMNGRFLSAPFALAVACFASSDWLKTRAARASAAAVAVCMALNGRAPAPFTGADFGLAPGETGINPYGIHDERKMFFAHSSLRNAARIDPSSPEHPWSITGVRMREQAARDPAARVQVLGAIGYAGYYAGPSVHIVDQWALADALLARLPAIGGKYGHHPRVLPEGYLDTLRHDALLIADKNLARYYHGLALVLSAPLFASDRLRAIWELNSGGYDDELDRYAYVRGAKVTVRARVRNPTQHALVTAYVFNDSRSSAYTIDAASGQGREYALEFEVTSRGARLLHPQGAAQTSRFDGLRERGYFTLSVAFAERPEAQARDIYELRYSYRLDAGALTVQRQPWPLWVHGFPNGTWQDGAVPDVLHVEALAASAD